MSATRAGAGTWAAAALLPPLGAFLVRGITRDFWITTGLTALAFVPGAAFALWLVAREQRAPSLAEAVTA